MTIQYHKSGDYYLPNLTIEDQKTQALGKYGRMRKRYLKEYCPVLYSNMLLEGKLFQHLAETDQACEERMELIIRQMEALAEASTDPIPVMANVSALLFYSMEDLNWAGFYLVKDGALILGPFQGKVACVRIEKGRGVCGTAWAEDKVLLVPDVHAFPGHIACDSASRSEIVVPIHRNGEVWAVLDIDSPILARFSDEDRAGLVELVQSMERILK